MIYTVCAYIYIHVYLVLKCFTNLLIHVQAKYDTIVFFLAVFQKSLPGDKNHQVLSLQKGSPPAGSQWVRGT